jgi:hypothetical protein
MSALDSFTRRLLLLALAAAVAFALPARSAAAADASVSVVIPAFKVSINDRDIDSTRLQYPLIVYKDISYFPLTWNWCRELGLASGYTETEGLYVANDIAESQEVLDDGGSQAAGARYTAVIPGYPVYINGRRIDNGKEPYPLLNFRNITYFPLTWRFVTDEFGWDQSWSSASGYKLSTFGRAEAPAPGTHYYQENLYLLSENYRDYAILEKSREERAVSAEADQHGGYNDAYVNRTITHYKLNYATDTLTEIPSAETGDAPYLSGAVRGEDADGLFSGEGAILRFRGDALLDLSEALEALEAGSVVDRVLATRHVVNGLTVYLTTVEFRNGSNSIPAPYTPVRYYAWISRGGETPRRVASWPERQVLSAVYPFGSGGVYLCSRIQVFGNSRLNNGRGWVCAVGADLSETALNGRWEDWNSLSAVGMDGTGNLYLLNTWFPEHDKAGEFGQGRVSPVRDGYFRLDTEGRLTKVYPFVRPDTVLVTPSGEIYINVANKMNMILHLPSGARIRLAAA